MTAPRIPGGRLICTHHWMSLCEGFRDTPYVYFGPGALAVALNDAGEALLTVEPTAYDNRPVLGLPGGGVEEGEAPDVAVNRELCEEIGFRARRLDYLGEIYPVPKYLSASLKLYLARDLTPETRDGDEGYEIRVERVPLDRFEEVIASGRLQDSSAITGLYMARAFLSSERA